MIFDIDDSATRLNPKLNIKNDHNIIKIEFSICPGLF